RLYQSFKARLVRLFEIGDVNSKEIDHTLVEEGRFPISAKSPNVTGRHRYKVRELPLAFPELGKCDPVGIEINRRTVPARDAPLSIARRHEAGTVPLVNTRRALDATIQEKRLTGLEAVAPRFRYSLVVIRMRGALEESVPLVDYCLEFFE